MDLIRKCKKCGRDVKLYFPKSKESRSYVEYFKRPYKAEPGDEKHEKHLFLELRNDDIYVVGRWIGKNAQGSFHGVCENCGKRIFEIIPRKDENEYVPAPRSIIKSKKVLNIVLNNFVLFELGKHWYKLPYEPKPTEDIKNINLLTLFDDDQTPKSI